MFDTFVGNIQCPHCKEITHFDEHTKNYECLMQEFKVGDYIDKGNANYFYKFDYPCVHCNKDIKIFAAIKRGQLVEYYTNVDGVDINALDNVEEGLQRKLEYQEMCKDGYGFDSSIYEEDKYYRIGNIIHTLNRDWIVEAVFEEKIKENVKNEKLLSLYKCMFKKNKCYRVHDKDDNKRLIISRECNPTLVTGLIGDINNEKSYRAYIEQIGTELVQIE